jgi:hypothetical protein
MKSRNSKIEKTPPAKRANVNTGLASWVVADVVFMGADKS